MQGGQVVGEDALHPVGQLVAPQVAHHGGEVADVVGDGVEFGAAGPNPLEVGGIIGCQVSGVGHDPADDTAGPWSRAVHGWRGGGGLERAEVAADGLDASGEAQGDDLLVELDSAVTDLARLVHCLPFA
ncbi:hypothetical protein [Streptomyces sp. NBC_00996]|uniref:hypothetical protein n=1 Tax=Streptomyces sp. NBC_00996 TaxID=2903710 RepID=UPI003867994C|nr:hypothetical protein OG390_38125 [Streptomyces sp. NBC_00996]